MGKLRTDMSGLVGRDGSVLGRTGIEVGAVVVVSLLVLSIRAPDVFSTPQFWAEDGSLFFYGAMTRGVGSILQPYAGYLHLVPRLVALFAARFSAVDAPAIYAYSALAITLWSAATVACSRAPAAPALAVMIVAVPGGYEIFGTITNVQWFMQTALLAIVASPGSPSRACRYNQAAFTVLSSLTGPFSVLLSPISLWRLTFGDRDAHERLIHATVIASAAIQLGVLLVFGDDQPKSTFRPAHLFWVMLKQSIEPVSSLSSTHVDCAALKIILIVATIALAIRYEPRFATATLGYFLVYFAATWIRNVHNGDNVFNGFGERYFYMPRLFIIWCACIVVGRHSLTRLSRSTMIAAFTLLVMFGGSSSWRRPPLNVLPWRSLASRIDAGEAVTIVINPSTEATPLQNRWRIELPARP